MNEPLALLLCSRGLIATQLRERLEALRYRIVLLGDPAQLGERAGTEKAMVVIADLDGQEDAVTAAVQRMRADFTTAHIPVIGFRRELDEAAQSAVTSAGFTVAVNEAAILGHLAQLLDRALDLH